MDSSFEVSSPRYERSCDPYLSKKCLKITSIGVTWLLISRARDCKTQSVKRLWKFGILRIFCERFAFLAHLEPPKNEPITLFWQKIFMRKCPTLTSGTQNLKWSYSAAVADLGPTQHLFSTMELCQNEKGLSGRIDFELRSLEDSKFRFLSMVIEVTIKHQMCSSSFWEQLVSTRAPPHTDDWNRCTF